MWSKAPRAGRQRTSRHCKPLKDIPNKGDREVAFSFLARVNRRGRAIRIQNRGWSCASSTCGKHERTARPQSDGHEAALTGTKTEICYREHRSQLTDTYQFQVIIS